jgi:hypothetical protein
MADEKNKGLALLDAETALFTMEANGVPVARRFYDEKAKCSRCNYDSTINIAEYRAGDVVFRVKSCGVCRHESAEGTPAPTPDTTY